MARGTQKHRISSVYIKLRRRMVAGFSSRERIFRRSDIAEQWKFPHTFSFPRIHKACIKKLRSLRKLDTYPRTMIRSLVSTRNFCYLSRVPSRTLVEEFRRVHLVENQLWTKVECIWFSLFKETLSPIVSWKWIKFSWFLTKFHFNLNIFKFGM